ncbi:MAG: High-affinity nickel transporter [Planctomycetes bacterium]|nr:High-affinity nickel transporter [Planctomycetota bacterium]
MHELLIALGTGIIAGIAHVYMGADHLAALMPLSVGRKLKAAWLGVRWGVGHSMGVIIVAVIFLVVRRAVNIDPLSEWGERIVGVMLIGLGIVGLRAAFKHKLHAHTHDHGEGDHAHLHVHTGEGHPPDQRAEEHSHFHTHAALAAGTLHGVAGMAHLMGVLPSLAFPTLKESFSYLGGFAGGTVAGMAFFAAAFGTITAKLGQKAPKMIKGSMYAAGAICIIVGVAWIVVPLMGYELP